MKKLIVVSLAMMLLASGCFQRKPTTHTYTKYIPPTTTEGKRCVMECEKIKLMKQQITEQKYNTAVIENKNSRSGNFSETDRAIRDLDNSFTESAYEKCFEECGGTTIYKQNGPKAPKKQSCFPPSSTSNVIKRDGIYEAYANGIVKDTKTGLEWKAGPDKNTDWNEAKSWVENLNIDGGGWRMPTLDELEGIKEKDRGDYKITPFLINTTSEYLWVWSGEKIEGTSKARLLAFGVLPGRELISDRNKSGNLRAFAVRCRNAK